MTGSTFSDQTTFPVKVGPDLTYNGDWRRLRGQGQGRRDWAPYAGYLGGTQFEEPPGIAVDSAGNVYLGGHTSSDQTTFPGPWGRT